MVRTSLIISILVLTSAVADARTFIPAPYIKDAQVNVLTRDVAMAQVNRSLFGAPYATFVVGNVDVYDRFPYIEARYFQVVSDPAWNRILMGEMGKSLIAYDGSGDVFGGLSNPRGLSGDATGRLFVADAGNDRVLVFQTRTEFDRIELIPLYSVDGLNDPYDVAYSDGGTPFDAADDRLYIANTGRNEVRLYELEDRSARFVSAIGELGSGDNHFAGPMALTVGRCEGAHCADIYVSDAHNSRLVRLQDTGASLAWAGNVPHTMGAVTSLDTDHWGNIYAASPNASRVAKYTPGMIAVASQSDDIRRPRNFHVPFATVTDHRTGTRHRAGQGSGVVVEDWSSDSGIRLYSLGVEITGASVVPADGSIRMTLTDQASVVAELTDPRTGVTIARRHAGSLAAGPQTLRFEEGDYLAPWEEGDYRVTVNATSTYEGAGTSRVELSMTMNQKGGPALPQTLTLLGNTPNPFNPTTTIRFLVPAGNARNYHLRVYDIRGRLVRELAAGSIGSGVHEVTWDGRNMSGNTVSSGIYLYRLDVGVDRRTGKMLMVK